MSIVHYPGEIKSMVHSSSAAGLEREGLVVKVEDTTVAAPKLAKITASGDVPFGIAVKDSYDQANTLQSGSSVYIDYVQEGEVNVAVEAGTYHPGEVLYVADTSDGYARATPSGGSCVGIVTEYKVVATGNYTGRTDFVRTKLCLERNITL